MTFVEQLMWWRLSGTIIREEFGGHQSHGANDRQYEYYWIHLPAPDGKIIAVSYLKRKGEEPKFRNAYVWDEDIVWMTFEDVLNKIGENA